MKHKVLSLEDAKKRLHEVSEEIKSLQKEFGISKRSRDICKLKQIIKYFGNKFNVNSVKLKNGLHRESLESRMFNLIKNKYWLEGFILAKLNSEENKTQEEKE